MSPTRSGSYPDPPDAAVPIDAGPDSGAGRGAAPHLPESWAATDPADIPPLRKAAIVLVSLEQSLASQLLSHLDRAAVELVTWEIARLDHVDPEERAAVLDEFYGLGLRRLCFGFDDLVKMSDADIRAAFHEEDLATWALALAGSAATVRARVSGALAPADSEALHRQLERLGPFRLSESEAAQLEIADRLRRLYDRGTIALPEPNGSDEVLI